MERVIRHWRALALDGWPLLLAVVLVSPLLVRPGHPLARDLVFVPHQPFTDAALGFSDVAPRAVPLDAVVSTLTSVIDGGVLARVVLPLLLALAGWGTHRLLAGCSVGARLVAGGAAVWNPFVVERMALGQWALLAAYAALPWLVAATWRLGESRARRDLASVVLWSALASLTPTGGLLAVLTVAAVGIGRARGWVALGAAALLQLPWVLAALLGPAGITSDPDGVAAFAARSEGPGGPVVALLGLGGVWDSHSMPPTRGTWLSPVAAAVVGLVLVVGLRALVGSPARGLAARAAVPAAIGLLVAVTSSVPGGADLVAWLVEQVPGAGLLRDAQKFLAPLVVLVAVCAGVTADRVLGWAGRWGVEARLSALLALVLAPVVLLPDGAPTVWRTVDPVTYPPGFAEVARRLDEDATPGAVVTLPWRSYRGFSWGHGEVSSDPAVRWFDRDVLVDDDLVVGDLDVAGESETAARVDAALQTDRPADALAPLGVSWVLVYRDDPDADALDLAGLQEEYGDGLFGLYRVPGAGQPEPGPTATARAVVVAGHAGAAVLVLLALVVRGSRRRRSPASATEW